MPHNETYTNLSTLNKEEEYENCSFANCSFVEVDLLSTVFEECEFDNTRFN